MKMILLSVLLSPSKTLEHLINIWLIQVSTYKFFFLFNTAFFRNR